MLSTQNESLSVKNGGDKGNLELNKFEIEEIFESALDCLIDHCREELDHCEADLENVSQHI